MICVDASVAAQWIFEEDLSATARALLADMITAGDAPCAPPLLAFELTNVVLQRVRRRLIPANEAREYLADFLALGVAVVTAPDMHLRALSLSTRFSLPAAYDAHYLALAEWLRCPFWTNDRRLVNTVGASLPFVRWIGDYQSKQTQT